MKPTTFPGRLVVSDEGDEIVHLDMYRGDHRLRIGVPRDTLRLYAQQLLEAANRSVHSASADCWCDPVEESPGVFIHRKAQ